MSIETLNWLRDYMKELDEEIATSEKPGSAATKEKMETRNRLKEKLDAAIGNIKMEKDELNRDQASLLKSAENALSEISYSGRDFDETSSFCSKVTQIFDIYISDDPKLHEIFASKVKQRFSPSIYSRLKNATEPTKTWNGLREWLNSTYDSGLSALQMLNRAMETNFDQNAPWKKYAQDVNDRMEPAKASILSQIRRSKMKKNAGTKEDDVRNAPNADDIFDFVSASIIAGRLKITRPSTHALLANEWANISDAQTVATKIEFLISQTTNQGGSVFFARQNQNTPKKKNNSPQKEKMPEQDKKSKMPICRYYNSGNCKKGNDCRFRHEKRKTNTMVAKSTDGDLPVENNTSSVFL